MSEALRALGYEYRGSGSDWKLTPNFTWKGPEDYSKVAGACMDWVRESLVTICGLEKIPVGSGLAYTTAELAEHSGPVLLLVCGSAPGGTAGVWGRSLCINDGTLSGSMFEAIARAKSRGWAVAVADPHGITNTSPHEHCVQLWNQLLKPSDDRPLLVLAHSYGASLTLAMLKAVSAAGADINCGAPRQNVVLAIALTDGMVLTPRGWKGGAALLHEGLSALATDEELKEIVDGGTGDGSTLEQLKERRATLQEYVKASPSAFDPPSNAVSELLKSVGRNWVVSEKAVGTRVAVEPPKIVSTVSAGTTAHPSTTHAALDDVFEFLDRAAGRRKRGRKRCGGAWIW